MARDNGGRLVSDAEFGGAAEGHADVGPSAQTPGPVTGRFLVLRRGEPLPATVEADPRRDEDGRARDGQVVVQPGVRIRPHRQIDP